MPKRPKTRVKVKNQKVPKEGPKKEKPRTFTWSFSLIDLEGPFGWHNCVEADKFHEVLKKKGELESFHFSQLPQQGSHSVKVSKLSSEAQKRLVEINQDDNDALYSFRISGKNRFWCILQGNIFGVLWWDPEHLVCPSQKKHT